jgi:hypothetical protein
MEFEGDVGDLNFVCPWCARSNNGRLDLVHDPVDWNCNPVESPDVLSLSTLREGVTHRAADLRNFRMGILWIGRVGPFSVSRFAV